MHNTSNKTKNTKQHIFAIKYYCSIINKKKLSFNKSELESTFYAKTIKQLPTKRNWQKYMIWKSTKSFMVKCFYVLFKIRY